jgi:mannose-1-phosphate guanylyltransferase / phosphomannomutase
MRTKTRLTITLSESILDAVDSSINGITVRNRSHAIETFIKKSLSPSIKTAVILAGGNKERDQNPCLTKIGKGYLLTHILDNLKNNHINRVIVCLHKTDTEVMRIFGKGENYGINIEYLVEEQPLGTGGAVKKAKDLVKNSPFLVIHGDTLTNIDLSNLFSFHFTEKSLATIAVKPRLGEPKYGQVFIEGNKIIKFLETSENSGISIINTGIYIFDPKIFEIFPQKEVFTLEKDVFPKLAKQKQLTASIFQGMWFDITDKDSLKKARDKWQEIQTN